MPMGLIYKVEDKVEEVVKLNMKDFHLLGENKKKEENDAKDEKEYEKVKKTYKFLNKNFTKM